VRTAAHPLICLLVASALQLAAHDAHSTTVRALTLEDLTLGASVVVMGRVVSINHRRTDGGPIVRDVTVRVEEYVVGDGPEEITVRLLGGAVGEIASHVPGAIRVTIGQEAVFFLERPEPTARRFVSRGLAQGCFPVSTDPASGARFVHRDLGPSLHMVGPATDVYSRSTTSIYLPLDELLESVRAIAGREEEGTEAP
jgi:hypothetical protein